MVETTIHNVEKIIYSIHDLEGIFVNRIIIKTKEGSHRIILFSNTEKDLLIKKVNDSKLTI